MTQLLSSNFLVPYENKAVISYFMDVSRANFYAKLCMKLGAYEKRLWNYFKIMCMKHIFLFPALVLVITPFVGNLVAIQPNYSHIVVIIINHILLPDWICKDVVSFRFLNWIKDFSPASIVVLKVIQGNFSFKKPLMQLQLVCA